MNKMQPNSKLISFLFNLHNLRLLFGIVYVLSIAGCQVGVPTLAVTNSPVSAVPPSPGPTHTTTAESSEVRIIVDFLRENITITTQTTLSDIEAVFGDPCDLPGAGPKNLHAFRFESPIAERNPCSISVTVDEDNTLEGFTLYLTQFEELPVQDLIDAYGPPELLRGGGCGGTPQACSWLLLYGSQGFDITFSRRFDDPSDLAQIVDIEHIFSNQPLETLRLFPPISIEKYRTMLDPMPQADDYEWDEVWLGSR